MLILMLAGTDATIYIHKSFRSLVVIPSASLTINRIGLEPLINIFREENGTHINVALIAIS